MLILPSNIKECAQERVCVIDGYPIIDKSLKQAFISLKKLGLSPSLWSFYKKDVQRFFYYYCIQNLHTAYLSHKTKYRKVLVFQKSTKNTPAGDFIKTYLPAVLKACTFPWCEVNSLNTPELGAIASRTYEKQQIKSDKLESFLKKYKINKLAKKIKKNIHQQKIIVDFSGESK